MASLLWAPWRKRPLKTGQREAHATNNIGFCEACVGGKHQRGRFETSNTKEILELTPTCVVKCVKNREEELNIL